MLKMYYTGIVSMHSSAMQILVEICPCGMEAGDHMGMEAKFNW